MNDNTGGSRWPLFVACVIGMLLLYVVSYPVLNFAAGADWMSLDLLHSLDDSLYVPVWWYLVGRYPGTATFVRISGEAFSAGVDSRK
jgi:hypothetical protein